MKRSALLVLLVLVVLAIGCRQVPGSPASSWPAVDIGFVEQDGSLALQVANGGPGPIVWVDFVVKKASGGSTFGSLYWHVPPKDALTVVVSNDPLQKHTAKVTLETESERRIVVVEYSP